MPNAVAIPDGSLDFSGGVDSIKVSTVASQQNPNGLQRNQLAWLVNATVRDGGIYQRWGWVKRGRIHPGGALYQGAMMYEPVSDFPYPLVSIGGHIYRVSPEDASSTDLSTSAALTNPSDIDYGYFVQGEQFGVIQAGDFGFPGRPIIPGVTDANGNTLPLFWDGNALRRSIGITNPVVAPGTPGVNEIPAATTMDYFMGRLWYAQNRQISAGDIVGGTSGTLAYDFRDSILNVTENPLVVGGDGFTIPTNDGNIRGIRHGAAIDAALGEGRLFIYTSTAVYALQVPVTRTEWIAANNNNQPLLVVVQLVNGSVNDRSIVPVNGDLFNQALEPSIRSLLQAVRYFQQWGNISISANENRVLQFNNRALLRFSSGIQFDNRLLETALPRQVSSGVVHDALIPLDFVPISSYEQQKRPNWEGIYEGLPIAQLLTGNFGGRERAFAITISDVDGGIDLWELTIGQKFDINRTPAQVMGEILTNGEANPEARVVWQIEFPAFTWGKEFDLKKLVGAELWIDRLHGRVDFRLEWRTDGQTCYHLWHEWFLCAPRTLAETCANPLTYPTGELGPEFRQTITLPKPPENCVCPSHRPGHQGYQFQPRLTIKGPCRVRGFILHAESMVRKLYDGLVCG